MTIALIDNGSLEPAAHRNLRTVAAELSRRAGIEVHAVSWKHSDRIAPEILDGERAWTLRRFVEAQFARGEHEFVFVPFFISAQGAIGSALRNDLAQLQGTVGAFEVAFTEGLAARGAIPTIVAQRICETIAEHGLQRPAVIVVDHGGPSATSAALRDSLAHEIEALIRADIRVLRSASMEGDHGPLLADLFTTPDFMRGDVVIAPLFLAPGRHAGPSGDLAQIAQTAQLRLAGVGAAPVADLRCHFAGLVGTHPLAIDALTQALRTTLSPINALPFA